LILVDRVRLAALSPVIGDVLLIGNARVVLAANANFRLSLELNVLA
jgi:hypothetical protein